jgi:hypothetical protein
MPDGRHRERQRSGQITVLLCALIFVTVCILGLTLNIGEIFAYHGHLQTCTDCSAYSGAVVQARGLNDIAKLNEMILRELEFYRTRAWNGGHPYSSQSAGNAAAAREQTSFNNNNTSYNVAQTRLNANAYTEALSEADRIAGKNEPGIQFAAFPSMYGKLTELERVEGRSRNFRFRYYYYYWTRESAGRDSDGNAVYRRVHRRGVATDSGPEVTAWVYRKGTADHTYFCARLLRPAKVFIFTMAGRLGADFRNLRTYATAMPFGGNLWNGFRADPAYDVKLVRTGDVRPLPAIPDSWGYDW